MQKRARNVVALALGMGTLSGLIAAPFVSPYSASKFALEALSDSLRVEMANLLREIEGGSREGR